MIWLHHQYCLFVLIILAIGLVSYGKESKKPNIIYVFADQWRAQATGYTGDVNAKTPNLDRLAHAGINFKNAVSI